MTSPTDYPTPDMAAVANHVWFVRYYLGDPAYTYVFLTCTASILLVVPSAILLRRISQRSDLSLFQYLEQTLLPRLFRKERRARSVWSNPVAWREAATRAGASVRGITRWLTILIGIGAAVYLLYLHEHNMPRPLAATATQTDQDTWNAQVNAQDASTRRWFAGLIFLELSVSLLVASNSSASAVTRETRKPDAGPAAGDAHHQPLLHLGEAARAGELSCCRLRPCRRSPSFSWCSMT